MPRSGEEDWNAKVVVRRQQAAERGLHPEHREVGAGDEHAVTVERLPVVREVGAEQPMRRDRRHGLPALEVAEHRVAEDGFAVPRVVARVRARLGSGRQQAHQPLGLRHGQRSKQQLVEQREDRRVRADAERQRDDRDDRDEGSSAEGAKGQPQMAHGEG